MKTRADVIVGVLQNLGIFAPGQTVRAAASSTVTYDTLKGQVLQNLGILTGGQSAGAAAGTTQTQATLIKQVLQNLQILVAGQATGAASGTTVTKQSLVDQVLGILSIYTFGQGKRTAASSTKTRTDLINTILQKLQTYGAGQSPSTDDVAAIEAELNGVLEELKTRGIYSGGITTTFPDDIFEPLASASAALLATPWGVVKLEGIDTDTYRRNAESRLLKAEIARGAGDTLVSSAIPWVISELNNRGVYSGSPSATSFAIDIVTPIASITAAMMADRLGMEKINGLDVTTYRKEAEGRLQKIELVRTSGTSFVTERLPSVLNELKNRGVYSGGVSATYADDVVAPLASASAALMAEPLGIEKINGVDLFTYRADAEKRLLRIELVRGSASTMLNERINGAIEELKTRGIYLGGVTTTYPDDIYVPLAAAVSPMVATPLGIEKIDGMDLDTYRLKAEDRLYRADLARGRGYDMVEDRLDGVIAELSSLGIYGGVSDDEFEDEVFPSLTEAAAALLAVPFRLNQVAGMDVESYRVRAESRLRRIFQTGYRSFVTRAEYF